MSQPEIYLEEFPVNEEGLLLVDDLALIEALRQRRARQEEEHKQLEVEAS